MNDREQDVLALCRAVLNTPPNFWDNPNGAYESTCPFCGATEFGGGEHPWYSIDEIEHKQDCAYLIAKDLSTNL